VSGALVRVTDANIELAERVLAVSQCSDDDDDDDGGGGGRPVVVDGGGGGDFCHHGCACVRACVQERHKSGPFASEADASRRVRALGQAKLARLCELLLARRDRNA
jgi:hypothetical protein